MELGLKNKTALVLGASRGLGAAIARGLAEEGVTVHAAARNTSAISAWASELASTAGAVIPLQLDLSDIDSLNEAIASLVAGRGVSTFSSTILAARRRPQPSMRNGRTGSTTSRQWPPTSST